MEEGRRGGPVGVTILPAASAIFAVYGVEESFVWLMQRK